MELTPSTPSELARLITSELGLDATGFESNERTVVVHRNEEEASHSAVEALAERNGYFVFATDAQEFTLVAREDCEWKSDDTGVVEVPSV